MDSGQLTMDNYLFCRCNSKNKIGVDAQQHDRIAKAFCI
jgi:hypothetical protein